jgi:hypothetical protein
MKNPKRQSGWRRLAVIIAAASASAAITASAAAQVERSGTAIQACLCLEQSVAALKDGVEAQRRAYEDKREAFQVLDNQVRASRPQVNVNNPTDVDAFKRLLEQRDAAADALAGPVTTNYADAVSRYNQSVSGYNASCMGKVYDPEVLADVRRTLVCSKP